MCIRDSLRAGRERQPRLRAGLHLGLLYGRPGRRHRGSAAGRRARHGPRRPHPRLRRCRHRGPGQPRRRPRRRPHGGDRARGRHHVLPGDRTGGALPDGGHRAPRPARRALRTRMSGLDASPRALVRVGVPVLIALAVLPFVAPPYQTVLLSYGLIFAIAALGFNLLLGYTGLLSFGHSAYFGMGAYAVALSVKYFKWTSMEAFLLSGLVASALIALVFGFLCVRYTRIFFGILAMALSQVLWSLAFKFFWVTGGSDGLRVPTPTLLGGLVTMGTGDK